jgi:hypothetical protein
MLSNQRSGRFDVLKTICILGGPHPGTSFVLFVVGNRPVRPLGIKPLVGQAGRVGVRPILPGGPRKQTVASGSKPVSRRFACRGPPTGVRPPRWTMHSNPPPLRDYARQWEPRLGSIPECPLARHIPRGELAGTSTLPGPVATPPRSAYVRREAERGPRRDRVNSEFPPVDSGGVGRPETL